MTGAVTVPSAATLARRVVASLAPQELLSFEELAAPYLADPHRSGRLLSRRQDEPLNFDPGEAVTVATPVVALVCASVVTALSEGFADSVRSRVGRLLRRSAARLRRGGETGAQALSADTAITAAAPVWTTAHLAKVRKIVRSRAVGLGLRRAKAEALADAVVGELVRLHDKDA